MCADRAMQEYFSVSVCLFGPSVAGRNASAFLGYALTGRRAVALAVRPAADRTALRQRYSF